MSLKTTLAAPFASFLSKGPRAARAEDAPDDGERKQRDGESDDDYAKRMDELDEKENAEQDRKDEEARRAEQDRKDEEARQAAAADDDGDDETDDAQKAARAAERARCARIVAHGINIGATRQAGVFAFDTKMSSKAAISALNAGRADTPQAARKPGLAERMAAAAVPNPGAGGAAGQMTTAQQIVLAGKKRRGEA